MWDSPRPREGPPAAGWGPPPPLPSTWLPSRLAPLPLFRPRPPAARGARRTWPRLGKRAAARELTGRVGPGAGAWPPHGAAPVGGGEPPIESGSEQLPGWGAGAQPLRASAGSVVRPQTPSQGPSASDKVRNLHTQLQLLLPRTLHTRTHTCSAGLGRPEDQGSVPGRPPPLVREAPHRLPSGPSTEQRAEGPN